MHQLLPGVLELTYIRSVWFTCKHNCRSGDAQVQTVNWQKDRLTQCMLGTQRAGRCWFVASSIKITQVAYTESMLQTHPCMIFDCPLAGESKCPNICQSSMVAPNGTRAAFGANELRTSSMLQKQLNSYPVPKAALKPLAASLCATLTYVRSKQLQVLLEKEHCTHL